MLCVCVCGSACVWGKMLFQVAKETPEVTVERGWKREDWWELRRRLVPFDIVDSSLMNKPTKRKEAAWNLCFWTYLRIVPSSHVPFPYLLSLSSSWVWEQDFWPWELKDFYSINWILMILKKKVTIKFWNSPSMIFRCWEWHVANDYIFHMRATSGFQHVNSTNSEIKICLRLFSKL